ncbi:MAG: Electron transfer flavoprotein-ubiquinone oxidoreductase [Alphaproteobacteria bacterium MarineAlpha9_Bin3]|nr:MAG: Electron transfer flavoprotein-ubiquinone oxidoreductase [Alphaproteobacteria bacterium MarineAlpha9_Bin3]|tara:strand:- start:25416 stop:27065 length:1650 start_codon:yes stop_codon:yes gene_type:complete
MRSDREKMDYDVVIVGAGPAGLSAAIKLKQLSKNNNSELSVCIVEKGPEVGAHILSGAVFETRALIELFPNWKEMSHPKMSAVTEEKFIFLSKNKSIKLPNLLLPKTMKNHNNYIISLANMCRWLAEEAEKLGVEIYPGFAAKEILYDDEGSVIGIATGDMGVDKNFDKTPAFEAGIELLGKYTLFAEGCRGHLGKQLIKKYNLDKGKSPQSYGIGLKEIWEIDSKNHKEGKIMHSAGWPLTNDIYGGSFLYHMDNNQISIGFVMGLDYKNPNISPYEEFQKFKTHPDIKKILKNGRRIAYGARALNEGGYQSLPKLYFPGGALIGCEAGTLNVPKIKGTHTAMKSGMLASEIVFKNLQLDSSTNISLKEYEDNFYNSWAGKELKYARNFRPGFKYGLVLGTLLGAIDQKLFKGKAPWTIKIGHADHKATKPAGACPKVVYDKPDGVISFDRLTNLSFSGTNHSENQPCHLELVNTETPIQYNLAIYNSPERLYCPAGVYEIVEDNNTQKLQINSQNCLHCKTCDIKDPSQNINWTSPEGGGGPNYPNM